jgi:hypothetical protein
MKHNAKTTMNMAKNVSVLSASPGKGGNPIRCVISSCVEPKKQAIRQKRNEDFLKVNVQKTTVVFTLVVNAIRV